MENIANLKDKIKNLPDVEKLKLVDAILEDLDKPDPELDKVWSTEAHKRKQAHKQGKLETVGYEKVMEKHRR
ncbi:MAG: addiction module protein [Deltaproteobacteria bacterium]|nr:addiction module protein [Deltaproteobacteria bacterium]